VDSTGSLALIAGGGGGGRETQTIFKKKKTKIFHTLSTPPNNPKNTKPLRQL